MCKWCWANVNFPRIPSTFFKMTLVVVKRLSYEDAERKNYEWGNVGCRRSFCHSSELTIFANIFSFLQTPRKFTISKRLFSILLGKKKVLSIVDITFNYATLYKIYISVPVVSYIRVTEGEGIRNFIDNLHSYRIERTTSYCTTIGKF